MYKIRNSNENNPKIQILNKLNELNGIKISKMVAGLLFVYLFGGVCVARRKGSFRLLPNLLDGLNEQEILSQHLFGSESIDHEYIMNLLKPRLERQTRNNSVNSAVDLSQVVLTVSVSQIMKLAYSCTAKYSLRLL